MTSKKKLHRTKEGFMVLLITDYLCIYLEIGVTAVVSCVTLVKSWLLALVASPFKKGKKYYS